MKAVAFSTIGPPDVLRVMEFEDPQAGNGQIRVKIKAAGVQPADCGIRGSGWAPPNMTLRMPQILGNEFAGTIDQVGEGVRGFKVGEDVIGWSLLACYAEYVVVSSDQVVRKPDPMPWEEAGVLTAAGQTAHTALQALGVGEGDTVLIHAAAGGVGSYAVQLARAWGARVIGTASERNHDYLRSLGAVPVVYGPGLVARVKAAAPEGVSAALDAAGEEALLASLELVGDRSRIGTIVAFDRVEELGVLAIRSQRSKDRLAELVQLYEQGKLQIHVSRAFSLSEAAEAHRAVESGHVRGKVVLRIDQP
ncbi:NADP-dependent oxidoreductase [Paenibacillus sp. MDMC362]|uniref:NADP-dependent oxidoreductase n=1 Tax=Paenibacillus sp. MDMC362 TaxID=2977365 RepID=UPI000DC49001|nr:NADP-dependent oxidoreductase [Paenibacillus sp. MDMC362]RAR41363.1 NADP-dependent oxidoreductase [Paenibacillus sp. MDMC362]